MTPAVWQVEGMSNKKTLLHLLLAKRKARSLLQKEKGERALGRAYPSIDCPAVFHLPDGLSSDPQWSS